MVGLSLLYASAYYLTPTTPLGAYFLPSSNLYQLIILPSASAVLAVSLLVLLLSAVARRWASPRACAVGAILILSLLVLIALKGMFAAAGYDWRKLLPGGSGAVQTVRYTKYLTFAAVLAVVWAKNGILARLARGLSSLGFAFGALAAVQILVIWRGEPAAVVKAASAERSTTSSVVGQRHRRAVWILFDETDFRLTFSTDRDPGLVLANLQRLSQVSLFATDARSPASATLYSIPALLTGVPVTGKGVHISKTGSLSQDLPDGGDLRFDEESTIFGKLAATGQTASVLGFYHPYCRLFVLQRCDSFFAEAKIGGLDSALWSNVPDVLAPHNTHGSIWESITRDSLGMLPEYLQRDDALTFIHLNIPHLPSDYADRTLKLPASSNPLTEYGHNLVLADAILGQITESLERQAAQQDLLLIVTTDHWLRNMWYQPKEADVSKPVLFMVWKVGETQGITASEPLSTVNTASMILAFLGGKLSTQADIAQWWQGQPVYPTFIAPSSNGF